MAAERVSRELKEQTHKMCVAMEIQRLQNRKKKENREMKRYSGTQKKRLRQVIEAQTVGDDERQCAAESLFFGVHVRTSPGTNRRIYVIFKLIFHFYVEV